MVELPVELGFAQWHTTFQKRQYTGVESLRLIATTFDQLRLNNSKDLVAAARAVADGSKDGEIFFRLDIVNLGVSSMLMV